MNSTLEAVQCLGICYCHNTYHWFKANVTKPHSNCVILFICNCFICTISQAKIVFVHLNSRNKQIFLKLTS